MSFSTLPELGAFLRSRRERLTPDEAGFPAGGHRRTPGLRREELAVLAGVSPAYLTRLEQGKDSHPSAGVLLALSRALRLEPDAAAYLYALATDTPSLWPEPVEIADPGALQLLDELSAHAVVLIGRYRDVLASTERARVLNPGFRPGVNLLRHTFLDPGAHAVYRDWEEIARGAVAGFRAAIADNLDDAHVTTLVGDLSVRSEDFARIWGARDVANRTSGVKRYLNPWFGELRMRFTSLSVVGARGQTLYVFRSADASSEASMTLLLTDPDARAAAELD